MEDILRTLEARGFLAALTDPEMGKLLREKPVAFYAGFDPTAPSLHVGNLLVIMGMAQFQRHGHTPIAVVGGGTGLIGDPSGKTKERQLLGKEDLEFNLQGIKRQLEQFLDFSPDSNYSARLVNNADWLTEFKFVDFLRDIGKHFRLGEMLAKESVKLRLESDEGMSFTEFCYQLLQAYDFLHLFDTHKCMLQVGGSDQWGNITAGIDLIRKLRGQTAYGVTFPLLTTATGQKFGKTEAGTIWLDPERTPPYDFYQYFVRTDDRDVVRFLNCFTFLPAEEIKELRNALMHKPEAREAQKRLAFEVTKIVHGESLAKESQASAKNWYLSSINDSVPKILDQEKRILPKLQISNDINIANHLIEEAQFVPPDKSRLKLEEAVNFLNNCINNLQPGLYHFEHAAAYNSLGIALGGIALQMKGKDRADKLNKAIAAYEAAQQFDIAKHDQLRAAISTNLATALEDLSIQLSGEEKKLIIERAIENLIKALNIFSPNIYPINYIKAANNLANTLRSQAEMLSGNDKQEKLRISESILKDALRTDKDALDMKDLIYYVMTFNNLGVTLGERVKLADDQQKYQLINEEILVFNKALNFDILTKVPINHASVLNNLGIALAGKARLSDPHGKSDILRQAIDVYNKALSIFKLETNPYEYAGTQNNLGTALVDLSKLVSSRDQKHQLLQLAIEDYKIALTVYSLKFYPADYAMTYKNLGAALSELAEILPDKNKIEVLKESKSAFEKASLDIMTTNISEGMLNKGILLVDALVETKLCKSKSEARRLIGQGGAYVNDEPIKDVNYALRPSDLKNQAIVLRGGKKNYHVLVVKA